MAEWLDIRKRARYRLPTARVSNNCYKAVQLLLSALLHLQHAGFQDYAQGFGQFKTTLR